MSKDPDDGGLFDISRRIEPGRYEKEMNVILISIESLSAEFLARFGNAQNITPFLDVFAEGKPFFHQCFCNRDQDR